MDLAFREYIKTKIGNLRTASQVTLYISVEDLKRVDDAIINYYLPLQRLDDYVMENDFIISIMPLLYNICQNEKDGCVYSLRRYMDLVLEEIKIYHQKILSLSECK